jgi:phosphohistidine phosphatase
MAKLPDWIYQQSAVLPYRGAGKDIEVLLISSRKGRRWVLPKGIVDPGYSPAASAAKEAREEAGVAGAVGETSLGSYSYDKWGGTCSVEVFPMEVEAELPDWPESAIRQRQWMPLAEAAKKIDERPLRKILRRLPKAIKGQAAQDRPPAAAEEPRRLIHLLRHARTGQTDPGLDDFERPLSGRGQRACKALRRYLRMADVRPDLVLCSSSARSRETLERLLPVLGDSVQVRFDRRLYTAGRLALSNRLRRLTDEVTSVLLVGHQPGIQALALELAGDGDPDAMARLESKFPSGALASLVVKGGEWSDIGPGSCELHSFVAPSDLA